ncbi:hypothetical protein TrVFT333_009587 [Trichoderma virens FT-333]|nr:hypothetical protein TrVFT333_009587 [Trichoderma virens FT-333]
MTHSSPVPSASAIPTTNASPTPGSSSAPLPGSTAVPSPADGAPPAIKKKPLLRTSTTTFRPNLMKVPPMPGSQMSPSAGSSRDVSPWSINSAPLPGLTAVPLPADGALPAIKKKPFFKRKYDWKRHEDEFHERWRKYPCPEPGCNRSFWGPNLFNQHHKQYHGCKTCPHAEKVVQFLRKRKYWACGFCSALHPARERHVEHVARHFESGLGKAEWVHSRVIYGLLHQPLIHGAWDALMTAKQAEFGGRRPQLSWHPSKTGRAQGFLEKGNPGQLQDLLEFFSGDEGEAQWIVSVAYDLSQSRFPDWQTTAGAGIGEQTTPTPQHQQPTSATSSHQGMTRYFNEPSVALQSLVEKGVDLDYGNWTPLPLSAEDGHQATMEALPAIEGIDGMPQETRPVRAAPPTDSGYASWPGIQGKSDKRGDGGAAQSPQEPAEQDVDDTATEYSSANTTFSRQKSYIRELANDLFSKISLLNADESTVRRVSAILPELLKAFALKVGHDAPTQQHRDVMAFVHKHRRKIATAFTDISLKEDEEESERGTSDSDGMDLEELMSRWFKKESIEEVEREEEQGYLGLDALSLEDEEHEGGLESWLLSYREFIFGTEAYELLLARLRREIRLIPTDPDTIQNIRDKVLSSLPTIHKIRRMIIGGPAFSIGSKDTPAHVSRNGYIPRLEWISTKFILLWDEDDKRGWLVNGTSALLHVLRASLEYSSKGKFKSALLCKSEDLEESPTPFTADSAVDVLINPNNRNLKLYREGDGYLFLESLIERFYNILEKFIDHQVDITGECNPLYPCVATLGGAGKGWVDFTRAIHAVTLIGRGFGDIIKPAGANFCEYWAELPKQKYYIASCLSDLAEVMREHGSRDNGHLRLSDNLIWHTPTTVFASCQCKGVLGGDHCEPVQTFFPLSLCTRLLPRKHQIQKGNGAVIFGYNSYFSWNWGDTGNPQQGELDEEASASDIAKMETDLPKDSGIGSSLAWSDSEGQLSSRSRSSNRRSKRVPGESHSHTTTQDSLAFVKRKWYDRDDYKVGIICALPKELMAVRALFDDDHGNPQHYLLISISTRLV